MATPVHPAGDNERRTTSEHFDSANRTHPVQMSQNSVLEPKRKIDIADELLRVIATVDSHVFRAWERQDVSISRMSGARKGETKGE